ncbi:MAG: recombinase family protein [Eubacteriaceae bacterium]|nr:recombinase family protein [Eubacteriaceae bacterium]
MERNITVIPASQIDPGDDKRNKKAKKRVAAYCRVSTEMEEQKQSFQNQVTYYEEYIEKNPEYEMVEVYGDEGISGTSLKRRVEFKRMIEDCKAGKIDLIITKSISRFARNTQDCLHYSRMLKNLGIGIIFEKENVSTMDAGGELLFTILSSLAQEEARNVSENTKWGIRTKFQKGIDHTCWNCIMGFKKEHDGEIAIDEEQAKVVRRIYRRYEEGQTPHRIAKELNADGICGARGKPAWENRVIEAMLQNEKYNGDILLQKTITVDYLNKKCIKNTGQLNQYYVKDHHAAIIEKDEWEAVQLEIERRNAFCKKHNLQSYGHVKSSCTFISQVFCGDCGRKYGRKTWNFHSVHVWFCKNSIHHKGGFCKSRTLRETSIKKAIVIAWNSVVGERKTLMKKWKNDIEKGDPLQRMRARQMIELTAEGPIENEISELSRMVLESIYINEVTTTVNFLDGTTKEVRI